MRDIVAAWGNLLKRGADSAENISEKFFTPSLCVIRRSTVYFLFRCGCCSLSSAEVGLACGREVRKSRLGSV